MDMIIQKMNKSNTNDLFIQIISDNFKDLKMKGIGTNCPILVGCNHGLVKQITPPYELQLIMM